MRLARSGTYATATRMPRPSQSTRNQQTIKGRLLMLDQKDGISRGDAVMEGTDNGL